MTSYELWTSVVIVCILVCTAPLTSTAISATNDQGQSSFTASLWTVESNSPDQSSTDNELFPSMICIPNATSCRTHSPFSALTMSASITMPLRAGVSIRPKQQISLTLTNPIRSRTRLLQARPLRAAVTHSNLLDESPRSISQAGHPF